MPAAPRKSAPSRGITAVSSNVVRALGAATLAAVMVLAPVAEATVLRGLTPAELRNRSALVVEGTVVKVRSERSQGRVETRATVRVRQTHKGEAGRRIDVITLGGEVGKRRMIVPGAASLQKGERVLLFLYPDGDSWRATGMFQGVWRLEAGGAIARASDPRGASLLAPDSGRPAVDQAQRPVADLLGGLPS